MSVIYDLYLTYHEPSNPSTGQGSGLYGSLKSGDLSAAAAPLAAPPPPAPGATYTDIPLSGMRETIAKRLSAAKQTIPHYQLCATVNVEKLLDMRKEVNARLAAEKSDVKVINPYYTQLNETTNKNNHVTEKDVQS